MTLHLKFIILVFAFLITSGKIKAQCDQTYSWTMWQNFTGRSATGTINNNGQNVSVTMTADYNFRSTPGIYGYNAFKAFSGAIPNTTVPLTSWGEGAPAATTMCFNQTVANPVLLLSSVGAGNIPVALHFSLPYSVIYDGGGMKYIDDSTISGQEGYAILLFPGSINCLTIRTTMRENYTNLSWGLEEPLLYNCNLFPTAFTPNNDGRNDVFRVLNPTNLSGYNLAIYNRWGQKIFETKDDSAGWNGTLKGNMLPAGVYIWYSTFSKLGKTRRVKGTVLLIR